MEEDEEVAFENSLLFHNLKHSGYFESETISVGDTCNYATDNIDSKYHVSQKRIIDNYNVLEEILAIKSANLLFEDDLNHIDNVLACVELNKNEPLKHIFRGSLCAFVLAVGLGLYFIIGYYVVFLISIYYTYRASDYLWKKHRRLKMLKSLIDTMKCNFSLLTNVLKFLQENENMVKSRFSLKESEVALKKLQTLKNYLIQHEKKINELVANFTCFLINELPLLGYIDDVDNYICKSIEPMQESESVSQLYNIYMLLQSQFLTRLTFSIVPSLLLNAGESYLIVYKTMYKITSHLKEFNTLLDIKFKNIRCNGLYVDKNRSARPLARPKPDRNTSVDMLLRNVHELSNSLQYSLIKARELETHLETKTEVNAGKELEDIQRELSMCKNHIVDLLILQNPSRSSLTKPNTNDENYKKNENEIATVTELGYPDYFDSDSEIDDDIFEAIINDSTDEREICVYDDDDDIIDPLAKNKIKMVLTELKIRLKKKADEWSCRESAIRARKGLPLNDELPLVHDDSSDSSECERPIKKTYREKYGDSSSDNEFDKKINTEFQQVLLQVQKNLVPETEYWVSDTCKDNQDD